MRRLAIKAAVISFFGLAIVGSLYEVAPFACAVRAGVGAVVVFVMVKIVGRVLVNVMVDTIVRTSADNRLKDRSSDSRTG